MLFEKISSSNNILRENIDELNITCGITDGMSTLYCKCTFYLNISEIFHKIA